MDSEDLLDFASEGVDDPGADDETSAPWRILITDDESDVHAATTFALKNTKIFNRSLFFFHARTTKEAFNILRQEKDIAVILLDVVMETPNAGLDLVARIRNELGNKDSRIILRTGQPNQAPEIEVIRDYDINDYKLKSELTQNKLYACLTAAIRSYKHIRAIEQSKAILNLMVHASAELIGKHSDIRFFAQEAICKITSILSLPTEGLICLCTNTKMNTLVLIAAEGRYKNVLNSDLDALENGQPKTLMQHCIETREHQFVGQGIALYLGSLEKGYVVCYLPCADVRVGVDKCLLSLFCNHINVDMKNIELLGKLKRLAYEDQLLSLPNRNAMDEKISDIFVARETALYAFACLDIDNFAEINVTLGPEYSNVLLREVANRLIRIFNEQAFIARISADGFGVLARSNLLSEERIQGLGAQPYFIDSDPQQISITSALVPLKIEGQTAGEVIQNASVILKQAKKRHRGGVLTFSQSTVSDAKKRLALLKDLRTAFSCDKLFLVFQPKLDLSTNSVSGFEALLRWQGNDDEIRHPDSFIDLAEHSGLIVHLGEWVLKKAILQLKKIHERGWLDVHMSVNVSVAQLRDPGFLSLLKSIRASSPILSSYVELEITESVSFSGTESEINLQLLKEIKALGYSLSIDDFGTGYSSLHQLGKMPVDRLKIDRSFVNTSHEKDGRDIIEMIIQLGSTLGMQVVAEGVEKESELRLLREFKCDAIQGFLYAQPMNEIDLEAWMETHDEAH